MQPSAVVLPAVLPSAEPPTAGAYLAQQKPAQPAASPRGCCGALAGSCLCRPHSTSLAPNPSAAQRWLPPRWLPRVPPPRGRSTLAGGRRRKAAGTVARKVRRGVVAGVCARERGAVHAARCGVEREAARGTRSRTVERRRWPGLPPKGERPYDRLGVEVER
eukprot:scaffold100394_cov24-Tisochrysis_lutea.AAC.1